jgi:dienelactone hydrolase
LLADYAPDLKKLGYASGTMKAIWDNIRALDYLESLPYVKKGAIGAVGHSLGGHNSLYTAAFDERIKAVVTSCGFDSFHDYMNGNVTGWTSERYMPRLLNYPLDQLPFDFDDVLTTIAPRPIFINAPTGDTNFKWESVDRIIARVRPIYEKSNASANLIVEHPNVAHSFPLQMRQEAYQLIDRVLRP